MLADVFGYIRRNIHNWNSYQIKKSLKEINQTKLLLEKKLKELEEAV
ncbi:hypothetical protein [Sporosarcina globispora]|nr:hypothetical protein [Sporosarcina globispora]